MEICYISENGNSYNLFPNKLLSKPKVPYKIKKLFHKKFWTEIEILDKNKSYCLSLPAIGLLGIPVIDDLTKAGKDTAENLKIIAEFCSNFSKFCSDFIWCVQNPINTLYIVMDYFLPLFLCFATIIPIVGLITLLFESDKLLGKSSKSLIVNPIIIFVIYIIIVNLLKNILNVA